MGFGERIKVWLIRRVILGRLIKLLDGWLAKLPGNDAKTVNGFTVALLADVVKELPQSSEYVQPLLDHLHELPAEQLIAGGLAWGLLGLLHKGIKILKKYLVPSTPVLVGGEQ